MAREYRIISGDSHLELSPDRWTPRVPARMRDRAPRRITMTNGGDGVLVESRPVHRIQPSRLNGVLTHDPSPTYGANPGYGGPEQRLREQDEDGLDAEILFTHSNYLGFWRGIRDDAVYRTVIHAYNEYLAEDYCPCDPDRLIAIGVIPPTGIEDAVAELEYCARAGLKGVALYRFPNGKGLPLPEDDRFWAAALDLRMPVTAHTAAGGTRFTRDGSVFPYPRQLEGSRGSRDPLNTELFRFCGDAAFAPVQMAFAGVFDRFPDLQFYWAETQIGWLPFALWQLDDQNEQFGEMFLEEWGLEIPERRLSEYLKEQNHWGFLIDPVGVSQRNVVGVDKLMWGSDFPHSATRWPHTLDKLEENFVGVPDDERHLMLAGNAVKFFHLDEN